MSRQYELNKELAQMLKGGVIMDVTTPLLVISSSFGFSSAVLSAAYHSIAFILLSCVL